LHCAKTPGPLSTLINEALRSHLEIAEQTLTADEIRKIIGGGSLWHLYPRHLCR
jgi:hypothetical protein